MHFCCNLGIRGSVTPRHHLVPPTSIENFFVCCAAVEGSDHTLGLSWYEMKRRSVVVNENTRFSIGALCCHPRTHSYDGTARANASRAPPRLSLPLAARPSLPRCCGHCSLLVTSGRRRRQGRRKLAEAAGRCGELMQRRAPAAAAARRWLLPQAGAGCPPMSAPTASCCAHSVFVTICFWHCRGLLPQLPSPRPCFWRRRPSAAAGSRRQRVG